MCSVLIFVFPIEEMIVDFRFVYRNTSFEAGSFKPGTMVTDHELYIFIAVLLTH